MRTYIKTHDRYALLAQVQDASKGMAGSQADPAALLRVLMKHGRVEQAATLALQYLKAWQTEASFWLLPSTSCQLKQRSRRWSCVYSTDGPESAARKTTFGCATSVVLGHVEDSQYRPNDSSACQ